MPSCFHKVYCKASFSLSLPSFFFCRTSTSILIYAELRNYLLAVDPSDFPRRSSALDRRRVEFCRGRNAISILFTSTKPSKRTFEIHSLVLQPLPKLLHMRRKGRTEEGFDILSRPGGHRSVIATHCFTLTLTNCRHPHTLRAVPSLLRGF